MGFWTGLAIYFTTWWTILFAILPIGVTTYAEAGLHVEDGGDPGAPVDPKLKQKAITTTWASAIVFAIIWATIHWHLITLPNLPGRPG